MADKESLKNMSWAVDTLTLEVGSGLSDTKHHPQDLQIFERALDESISQLATIGINTDDLLEQTEKIRRTFLSSEEDGVRARLDAVREITSILAPDVSPEEKETMTFLLAAVLAKSAHGTTASFYNGGKGRSLDWLNGRFPVGNAFSKKLALSIWAIFLEMVSLEYFEKIEPDSARAIFEQSCLSQQAATD